VEDGFHNKQDLSTEYYRNSGLSLYAALGAEIDAGSCLFQVQMLYNAGGGNVFNSKTMFGSANGRNKLIGIQIGFVY
jgi:hypothetical protein